MDPSSHPKTVRWYLYGMLVLAQVLAGIVSVTVTYVLAPRARETFDVGPTLLAAAAEPLVVPVGLAVGAYLVVRRFGRPTFDGRQLGFVFVLALASFYLGFWALGIPTPTPGRVPLQSNLAVWQLLESSPYLPYAWSVFLLPAIEGGIAMLAGAGVASLRAGR